MGLQPTCSLVLDKGLQARLVLSNYFLETEVVLMVEVGADVVAWNLPVVVEQRLGRHQLHQLLAKVSHP